jgi:DNA replication protein DnaC
MLSSATHEQLTALRLQAMASAWQDQQRLADHAALTFDERFGLLVEAQWLARENRRLHRSLREARLRFQQATLEAIEHRPQRPLDKALLRQLATGRWIREHQNVIITGATGTGKTFVACALAHQACRTGSRVLYRRVPRLSDELTLAHADGTYPRLLARLARTDLLVLDDWGLAPLRDQDRRDILEIIEDRYAARSTILTSQLPVEHWHDQIGDATIADAICDRLLHNTHRIVLEGPSWRKEEARSDT